ncbi:MAG: nucleotide exchange factor GrpE [Thermodesulfovibrio sp.]|jgi:molecular chaperone GrpE|uniref:nucleotide exchange factor GrpE n=1 Tax=unclassified Thermodesulfovibrio TaxID=2645936 RepID=UPI00083ABED3|nr:MULTISPECIES: nucleotide exchange factor GrpE [unclassified Thermodesulfovibrio]MDI1471722.1 nucleotide exchange factor GrpE [Thermodesulfovibrio sp. 1176]MDI6713613.1 nucleotide exchange factor GrpE [Thermodesulfovibrio sp.]ODA44061.1 Heat shock protein GrpE [Thermodesulfovibrio sp. N1]
MEEIKKEETKESEELSYEGFALEDKPRDVAETLQQELSEQKEKYLRLYAEFENYKKMVQKEKEELINYANEKLIKDLLPIIDNFELAIKHAGSDESSKWIESMKTGVTNTLKEFLRILEKYGVKPIETVGQIFNPEIHHAVSTVETDEQEENIILEELRKGYFYKNKLLREPLVAVSKKPKPSSEGETMLKKEE